VKTMKHLMTVIFLVPGILASAQTSVNKTIPVQAGQKIQMHFDYPNLIKISTWDKNEIFIQGTVSINSGNNDNAFEVSSSLSGNTILIKNEIRDMKKLPQRITITRGGQKITFKDRAEYQKYADQKGGSFDQMSTGVDIDIVLEIKVPKGIETGVESVYGMVEVKEFNGPLTVEATYGGVDASIMERATGELQAETNYGQIYSNLEVKFSGDQVHERDFHTWVSAKPGAGPRYSFESKYGNVYLRKPTAN
jgi:hypothetical protein